MRFAARRAQRPPEERKLAAKIGGLNGNVSGCCGVPAAHFSGFIRGGRHAGRGSLRGVYFLRINNPVVSGRLQPADLRNPINEKRRGRGEAGAVTGPQSASVARNVQPQRVPTLILGWYEQRWPGASGQRLAEPVYPDQGDSQKVDVSLVAANPRPGNPILAAGVLSRAMPGWQA